MSWHALPTELHLAIVLRLPRHDVLALASTSAPARALCLPAIFANVILPSAASLHAFAAHVPTSYGSYVRSLSVSIQHPLGATGALPSTDHILAVLDACTRLQSLSLSLASPLDPEKLVPAFARLTHVHSLEIGCGGTEDVTPVSERLVVALAASLPSLAHLTLSRITRSAIHVDPCDVPMGVPIVTNDFDVPPHPVLGSDLALPSLLRLASLRTLDIRDTWLGCDIKIDAACTSSRLEKLVLTGSMYSTESEAEACTAWLHACPSLGSLDLGTALALLPLPHMQPPTEYPRVANVHINASRIPADDLAPTLDALASCSVQAISISYAHARDAVECKDDKVDDFAHECAVDDLQDWSAAVDAFLLGHSKDEWRALARVDVSFAPDVHAAWDL